MKTEELIGLGLTEEQAKSVIVLHGKDIEKLKASNDGLKEENNTLKSQVEEANKQIAAFQEMDIDGIRKSSEEWRQKAEQAKADAEAAIAQAKYEAAEKEYFSGIQFSSESAKAGILAAFREKGFKLDNGKFLGADDWIKEMKETDAGAFTEPTTPKIVRPVGNQTAGGVTKESFAKMNYRQRLELKQNDPQTYEAVKE